MAWAEKPKDEQPKGGADAKQPKADDKGVDLIVDAATDLFPNSGAGQAAIGTEAAIVAIHAAADGHRAIDVGTGEPAIDRHAKDAAAEALAQKAAEGIVSPRRSDRSGGLTR